MPSKVKTILLICTGNSCRSVIAQGLLKKMLQGKGAYEVVSAGTAGLVGMRPTDEVIQVMSEQDIDVSGHRSSALSEKDIREADLILVMERIHKQIVLSHAPLAQGKTYLLSEFGRQKSEEKLVNPDIPDPIGKPLDFYRKVFDVIKEGILRTVKKLEEQ
ncbi:MAG: low molecular weight protein arginine phosphatase [Omnitrophica bacterium]|nr:low molecular weight protein arginine phosphatase [Candidatus Omnitrophota bacterium]